jgi:hypothetical protein
LAASVLALSSGTRAVDERLPRTLAMNEELNHWAACYHEAGHAVFAYEVGWWVNYEGIEVGTKECTGLGCREIDYTPWRRVCVFLAGLMAEYKFLRLKTFPHEDELAQFLADIRAGRHRTGDETEVLRALADQFPNVTDAELIDLYKGYQKVLLKEMDNGNGLWNRITHLAEALFKKPRLTPDEVEAVLEN